MRILLRKETDRNTEKAEQPWGAALSVYLNKKKFVNYRYITISKDLTQHTGQSIRVC